jgi:predicted NBD/HSP70 family sugar kinase
MFNEHMNTRAPRPAAALRVRQKATRSDTRQQNRRFVLQQIYANAPTTRANISRTTGLTRATVSDLVSELVDDSLVIEIGTAPSAGGKPPTLLTISNDTHHLVTVDLGGDRWTGSVMNLRRDVIETTSAEAVGQRGSPAIDAACRLVDQLLASIAVPALGIGIATPGVVTPEGTAIEATDLDWHGIAMGDVLTERFDAPVHVINDSRAIALAEYSLGEHGTENLFVVKVGAGIGAGIVLDGRLYRGDGFAAGEIGHMAVLSQGSGEAAAITLEDVASARAMAQQLGVTAEALDSTAVYARIASEVNAGSARARRVVERAGEYLGIVLASVTGILDIHHIIVTGPATRLGAPFLDAAAGQLTQRVLPAVASRVEISYGTIDRAAEQGAAMFVLNREMGIL